MKHTLNKILILLFLLAITIAFNTVSAAINKKPFGGKIRVIPSVKMTIKKNLCKTNLQYCPALGAATPTNASWAYSINENRTFTLGPDDSPTKGNLYYAPPSVKGTPNNKLSEGQYIKGLYSNQQSMQIGTCTCTYITDTSPPTTFTNQNQVSVTVSKISLWGNSEQ